VKKLATALVWCLAAAAVHAVPGDLNRDGNVDFDDFFILADNFGRSGPPEACGDEEGPAPAGSIEDFYPLVVGSEWIYENPNRIEDAYARRITGAYSEDGITYFEVNNGSSVYVAAGEYRTRYESGPESTLLKEPLVPGNQWQDDYDRMECPRQGMTCGSEIRSMLDELSTPAGEFADVLVVVWESADSDERSAEWKKIEYVYYIARSVGVVRREIKTYLENGLISVRVYELTEFVIPA